MEVSDQAADRESSDLKNSVSTTRDLNLDCRLSSRNIRVTIVITAVSRLHSSDSLIKELQWAQLQQARYTPNHSGLSQRLQSAWYRQLRDRDKWEANNPLFKETILVSVHVCLSRIAQSKWGQHTGFRKYFLHESQFALNSAHVHHCCNRDPKDN